MKNTLFLIAALFIFNACSPVENEDSDQQKVRTLLDELEIAVTREEEEALLTELWEMTYEDLTMGLSLHVTDASGDTVTNSLDSAEPPLEATLSISGSGWVEHSIFTPLSTENLMILLNE